MTEKTKKYLLFTGLIAFLVLSFQFQHQFYTLELGLYFGSFILVLIELTKIGTELTLFSQLQFSSTNRKWLSKMSIAILSLSVIGMSFYATEQTISRLNQNKVNNAQQTVQNNINYNKQLKDKKRFLNQHLNTLTKQLKVNNNILNRYSQEPRELWKISIQSIQKENNELKNKIDEVNQKIIRQSNQSEKFIPVINTKVAKMNLLVILFLAAFMEAGVLFLCWWITKETKKGETQNSTGQKDCGEKKLPTQSSTLIVNSPTATIGQQNIGQQNIGQQNKIESQPEQSTAQEIAEENWKHQIRLTMKASSLNQDKWSRQYLGISKQALHKILTGKTKKVSHEVQKKINALTL